MIPDVPLREPEVLPIEKLVLQRPDRTLLKTQLLSGDIGEAFCPCDLVRTFLVDHETAYGMLTHLEDREGWVCISLPDIFAPAPRIKVIPQALREREDLSPESRDDQASVSAKKETIAFVAPQLKSNLQAILNEPHIRAFEMVMEVSSRFVPNYRKTLLTEQPYGELFKNALRRGFNLLARLDLASQELANAKFAHSSVLMLIARALGTNEPDALEAYVNDPEGFVASALANALSMSANDMLEIRTLLAELLLVPPSLKRRRQGMSDRAFTFLKGDAVTLLRSVARLSPGSMRTLSKFLTSLDSRNERIKRSAGSLSNDEARRILEAIEANRSRAATLVQ